MTDEEEVLEEARKAICSRCKTVVVDDPSAAGTMMVNYYIPTLGLRHRVFMCGACGLSLREFLHPEAVGHPVFQAASTALRKKWS